MSAIETVTWTRQGVRLLDQRKLPLEETYFTCRTVEDLAEAIKNLTVRGAPAIGVAAACGVALAARNFHGAEKDFAPAIRLACATLAATRPTAVNLFWGLRRMERLVEQCSGTPYRAVVEGLEQEAQKIVAEDIELCRRIGRNGAALLDDGDTVLTHCNAGALCAAGYGTALGVIRAAIEEGKKIQVIADETRPVLQGARLTVWELQKDNIPVTLITDNMAGHFMARGKIKKIVVGADRIAANGDTANKIGTYSIAVLAKHHGIPFYVAAPLSTIDRATPDGSRIPIEERHADEVRRVGAQQTAPAGAAVFNPAFDVTPAALIAAIVTEHGVLRPPYDLAIRGLPQQSG
jgi:methylthioribose-1-phosphate isomerase